MEGTLSWHSLPREVQPASVPRRPLRRARSTIAAMTHSQALEWTRNAGARVTPFQLAHPMVGVHKWRCVVLNSTDAPLRFFASTARHTDGSVGEAEDRRPRLPEAATEKPWRVDVTDDGVGFRSARRKPPRFDALGEPGFADRS